MSLKVNLTSGAVNKILKGEEVRNPILQVLAYKNVTSQSDTSPRYRFIMSDGGVSHQCCIMMGADLIARLEKGDFERFAIIRLKNYICNTINDKKIIIMMEPEVVSPGHEVGCRIGNPVTLGASGSCDSSGAPAPGASSSHMSNLGLQSTTAARPPVNEPQYRQNNGGASPYKKKTEPRGAFGGNSNANNSFNAGTSLKQSVILPIKEISPYQNRWVIKGRVTSKGTVRTWSNAKGDGKLFSFDLQDESGEIRVTAFKDECDKFFEEIEVGKVIFLSKAVVKPANKKFSQLEHEFELTLHQETIIEAGTESDGVPQISYNFIKLSEIANLAADAQADVAGICRSLGEVTAFTSKANRELKKRDISLVDDSNTEIKLTLWGEEAVNFSGNEGSAIIAKRARVSEFNGKSLTTGSACNIQVDPRLPVAFGLKGWYDRNKNNLQVTSLSVSGGGGDGGVWKTLLEANDEAIQSSSPVSFAARATIVMLGRTQMYQACPEGNCKKKVIDMNNGVFRCEKCNKDYNNFNTRLIQGVLIGDYTSDMWVTLFHEEAEKLLGVKAEEFINIKENNPTEYEDVMSSLNFSTHIFKLKAAKESYKEETRVKSSANSVSQISPAEVGHKLVQLIKDMNNY